jgi:hypothetical protein
MSKHKLPTITRYQEQVTKLDGIIKLPLPTRETAPTELVEIADRIGSLTGTWNPVEIMTPTNYRAERQTFLDKFKQGEQYNPQFIYDRAKNFPLGNSRKELLALQQRLRAFEQTRQDKGERIARVVLDFKIKDDLATIDLVEGLQGILSEKEKKQGLKVEQKIAQALIQKYPPLEPNDTLLKISEEHFQDKIHGRKTKEIKRGLLTTSEIHYLKERKFKAPEIASAYTWALEQYGMLRTDKNPDGFAVVVDENTASIDVRDKSIHGPTVFIPAKKIFTGYTLLKNMAHEIERHARQSFNGQKLFIVGGGILKIDNEMLYEGLGKRYDAHVSRELFGTTEGEPLPYYTFAVEAATQGKSFSEIFEKMLSMRLQVSLKITQQEALPPYDSIDEDRLRKAMTATWLTTYRVMRGHHDTTNKVPFAMTKDLAYLRGYHLDKQLTEMGHGHINESAILATSALHLIAEHQIEPAHLPLPFKDITRIYWTNILKPQMQKDLEN